MVLLDTDHLTLLERGGAGSLSLQRRLDRLSASEIATTIISYAVCELEWHVQPLRNVDEATARTIL